MKQDRKYAQGLPCKHRAELIVESALIIEPLSDYSNGYKNDDIILFTVVDMVSCKSVLYLEKKINEWFNFHYCF